jgi:hypothetical protein
MAAPADTTVISNELIADIEVAEAVEENVQNTTTGQWYATIAAAVDAAAAGQTLEVHKSLTEDVTINKEVTLQAAADASPTLTGTITVTANNVKVDGLNFIKPDKDADSIVLNGVSGVTIQNCNFDANESMTSLDGAAGRAVQMNNNCSGVTIDNCTFKNGYYVTIQGRADGLTVQNSTIENCKSGINLQSGNNLVVKDTDISVKALGAENDTYCVRFASDSGTTSDMTITGGKFNVDKNNLTAGSDTYHSAIVVRAGAAGTLSVSDVEINGEVIDESGKLDLVSVLENNTFNDKYVVTSRRTIEEVANLTDIIAMSWDGDVTIVDGVAQFNATQGESFEVSVTADLGTEIEMSRGTGNVTAVDRVLYVIEVTGDSVSESTLTAIAEDNQQLGFKGDGCWYWGPPSGFTFDFEDGTASTTFNVTFNEAGSYNAKIYAVRVQ